MGKRYIDPVASHMTLTGDLAPNPGMCSDWELNWQPFGSQAGTQSTELQPARAKNIFHPYFFALISPFLHFPFQSLFWNVNSTRKSLLFG